MEKIAQFFQNNWINFIASGAVIVLAFLITFLIRKSSRSVIRDNISTRFVFNGLKIVIWVAAFCLIIGMYTDLSSIMTALLSGSGVAAVILGLAAQESFSNLFAGFFIAVFRPFNKNDRISIDGVTEAGYVEDINLRHTVIRTNNNMRLIVPNSVISKSNVENYSYVKGIVRPIDVEIAYERRDDRYRAMEIMEEIITSHPLFYDMRTDEEKANQVKPSSCLCKSLDESGITLSIMMRTVTYEDSLKACSECRLQILDAFEKEGIEIPYNKLVVYKRKELKD